MELEKDFSDTDPRALAVMIELQQKMSPDEKATRTLEMATMLLRLAETGVRTEYPEASDDEVLVRVAARHLDPDTVTRVYGWYPHARK
jgi:hypothetical protein